MTDILDKDLINIENLSNEEIFYEFKKGLKNIFIKSLHNNKSAFDVEKDIKLYHDKFIKAININAESGQPGYATIPIKYDEENEKKRKKKEDKKDDKTIDESLKILRKNRNEILENILEWYDTKVGE